MPTKVNAIVTSNLNPNLNRVAHFKTAVAKRNYDIALKELSDAAHNERQVAIKQLVSEILKLKKDNGLDDEDFSELISIVMAHYVENEINAVLVPKIQNKLSKLWMMGA